MDEEGQAQHATELEHAQKIDMVQILGVYVDAVPEVDFGQGQTEQLQKVKNPMKFGDLRRSRVL